ncbi:TadE/TadG family type IV pilus assembly protein [Siminovitchia sediminis]|uniref:TadE/TadG family type IV pilus assembly protein n=1 Tax=Siminovitchia sediminis TaxID=1274353 RepID=A0ABW4KN21_9BACI
MIQDERGQSLVEFALILPILLLIFAGIFDFGRVIYAHQQLELVTQEAVRLGGLGENDSTIRTYVQNHFTARDTSELTVSISPADTTRDSGDYVTVHVSYPESILQVFGDYAIPYTVKSSSTIRVE